MSIGWIKLHRQILNWEWYSDTNTFRLFLHLLLTANFKDQKYQGKLIKKGTLITGRDKLSYETGLSVREVNIPDFSDFLAYAIKEKPMVDKDKVQAKYDTWVSNGWKDGYDNKILNWKTKLKNTLPHIPEKVDISKMTSEELRLHITKGIAY